MVCPNCGEQTYETGKFCVHCGKDISSFLNSEKNDTNNDNAENIRINEELTYIVADSLDPDIELLNGERLEKFKKKYLQEGEFVFPIGKYCIRYPERIVMNINTDAYFDSIEDFVLDDFEENYSNCVHDMKSFFTDGLKCFTDAIDEIVKYTNKFLVGSGIMTISEDDIRKTMKFHPVLENKLNNLMTEAQKVYSRAQTESELIELNNRTSQSNTTYMGGGFGFSGALGGMAAMGIANVGASMFSSLKENIDKSRIDSKMKQTLDGMFSDQGIQDAFVENLELCVQDARRTYCFIMERAYSGISFSGFYDDVLDCLGDNTIKYITDKDIILQNLCKVLSKVYTKQEALECLIVSNYKDKETLQQLIEVSEFLLFDLFLEDWLEEAKKVDALAFKQEQLNKEEKMRDVFQLPESTISEIQAKINAIITKSIDVEYNCNEKVDYLKRKIEELEQEEKEADLQRAFRMPEDTTYEVQMKIKRVKEEADKINYDVSDKISQLQELIEKLKLKEKEAGLEEALSMQEKSVEDVQRKIERVKEEGEKIKYDVSAEVEHLQTLKERIRIENKCRNIGKKLHNIVCENSVAEHLIDLSLIMDDADANGKLEDEHISEAIRGFKKFYRLYLTDESEIPILFYDDTLLKSASDSFLLTTKKLLIANSGNIYCINIDDINSLIMSEKLFSPGIVVNNNHKILMVLAGKDKIRPFLRCIEAALEIVKELSGNPDCYKFEEEITKVATECEVAKKQDNDAKKNITYQELLESIEDIINRFAMQETKSVLFLNGSNPKKYNNAYMNYCQLRENEMPIVLFDNTVFGSAKEGFVITTKGIHFKNTYMKAEYVQFKESKMKVISSSYDIIIEGIAIGAACASKRDNFAEVVEKIIQFIITHIIEQ